MTVRFDNNLEVAQHITSTTLTTNTIASQSGTFSNTLSAKTVSGTTGNFSGNITAKAVSGTSGSFTGNITTTGNISGANLNVSSNITATGTITGSAVYNAVYNDYAEFFPRGEETEPGDIIALDENNKEERYIKATDKSKMVVGVHSDSYAHLIGGDIPTEGEDYIEYNIKNYIPIGLAGRVMVKFIGQAILGGKVVPSEVAGVGRLKTENDIEDSVIGRLVEIDDKIEIRKLKVVVK